MYFKFGIIFAILFFAVGYFIGYLMDKYDPEKCEACKNNGEFDCCVNCSKMNVVSKTCFYEERNIQKIVNPK